MNSGFTNCLGWSVRIFSAWALFAAAAQAGEFQFNFDPNSSGTALIGGVNVTNGTFAGNDGTRFYQEAIDVDGVTYIHVVVGDPALGFSQESYTASTIQDLYADPWRATAFGRPYSLHSGGNERRLIGDFPTNQDTIVARRFGNASSPFGATYFPSAEDQKNGNAVPLEVDERYRVSGVGTMDPTRMVLRLQVTDGDMSQEVFKPFLDRKPRISQTVADDTLSSEFVADMRGLTYRDINRAAPVINKMAINDPDMPGGGAGASFDMSVAEKSYVTAGRYIFSRTGRFSEVTDPETGAVTTLTKYGWQKGGGWDESGSVFNPGVYTYADDGFDPLSIDWTRYFDPAQN